MTNSILWNREILTTLTKYVVLFFFFLLNKHVTRLECRTSLLLFECQESSFYARLMVIWPIKYSSDMSPIEWRGGVQSWKSTYSQTSNRFYASTSSTRCPSRVLITRIICLAFRAVTFYNVSRGPYRSTKVDIVAMRFEETFARHSS